MDGSIKRLNMLSGNILNRQTGHLAGVTSLAVSTCGYYLLSGSQDSTALLWNIDTTEILVRQSEHKGPVQSVAMHPSSNQVFTGSWDQTIHMQSIFGKLINIFEGHKDDVRAIMLSNSGKYLLSGSDDGIAILWSVKENQPLVKQAAQSGPVLAVDISDKNMFVATGSEDATANVQHIHTGQLVYKFQGHDHSVCSVKFISNDILITGSLDKSIILWFLKDGSKMSMRGHRGSVLALTSGFFYKKDEDLDSAVNQQMEDNKSGSDEGSKTENVFINVKETQTKNWSN